MNTMNTIEPAAAEGVGTVTTQEGGTIYTFRRLNSTDVFLMFEILGKIGVNEFGECFGKDSIKQLTSKFTGDQVDDNNTTIVGISVMLEIANVIIGNLPECEHEIYQMLSNTSNLTVDEVKGLDFITFTEMVIDFVKKDEFKDFIKVVSRLFK